jgi:hypothetical protein
MLLKLLNKHGELKSHLFGGWPGNFADLSEISLSLGVYQGATLGLDVSVVMCMSYCT